MENRGLKTSEVVKEFGWQVTCVPEDEQGPSFAYSIGLQKTLNHPEILIMGLDFKLMHGLINDIGNRIKAGDRFVAGQRYERILSKCECLFAEVEDKYFEDYFGQAIDFYGGHDFQVLQCIWPDKNGLFPSDPGCADGLRAKQEMGLALNAPPSSSSKSGNNHSHKFKPEEWPFKETDNRLAFTTTQVLRGNYPILLVSHDEEGDWQFLCGTTTDSKDLLVVCMGCCFERDRSIDQVADLPVGWMAERESKDSPWTRWEV